MGLSLAMTAIQKGAVILLFTGVAAPLIGLALKRVGGGWESYGQGPFAILSEQPAPRAANAPAGAVDPAIQAAEVRQMLEAKAERLRRRGQAPLDVDAEAARLLADGERPPKHPRDAVDAELREEVRQLVVVRNQRRRRQGLAPLDVEDEIERQLRDILGAA
ncbi:MAG TPA: hypothetical protein VHI77_02235 [Solirubrobacterales bacterium]|jgi:hypothetical protein|nr:hypothetical protein [Solirubrobacterales bacterium]